MQRSLILFLLSLLSITFLWLQIYVLNNIEHSNKDVFNIFPRLMRRWTFKNQVENSATGLRIFLQDFNEACTKYAISFFITDPLILQSILKANQQTNSHTENVDKPNKCFHLCQKNSITIGIFEKHWNTHALKELRKKNIRITSLTGEDPRLANLERTSHSLIPLHFFFSRDEFIIHVTIFYDRGFLGFWHGPIIQNDLFSQNNKREKTLTLYEHFRNESILDRFSLRTSTVDSIPVHLPSEIDIFLNDLRQSRFLSCNFKRARDFYSKYGDDESDEAKTFRRRGKDVLQIAKINLDNLGIRFWLSSGTCLGWFRQCNVISHGKDMDIGIWIKDYRKELIEEFQKDGIYLHHILGKVEDSFQMSFRTIDDVRLDIFFFYEEGTYMWNGGTRAKTGAKYKYIFPNFSLCWTEFLEMKVRVPCETQAYIEANYGESWALPIKIWDWKKSPSNVIENGMWDKKDLPEVIQFFELQ